MTTDKPKTPISDDPPRNVDQTEPEQAVLKKAEDGGDDPTGGTGLLTGIAQA